MSLIKKQTADKENSKKLRLELLIDDMDFDESSFSNDSEKKHITKWAKRLTNNFNLINLYK